MNASPASKSLLSELEKIDPQQVAEAVRSCLSATTIARNGAVSPDFKTRLQAAGLVLDHLAGKPIQRIEQLTADITPRADIGELLRASPALRAQLTKLLEALE